MFKYSNTNKRYHTFDYYLKNKYNSKVFKVSLNAGFSCPNRDGKKGYNGCAFCSVYGAGENGGDINDSLEIQFIKIKKIMELKNIVVVGNTINEDKVAYKIKHQLIEKGYIYIKYKRAMKRRSTI